MDAIKKLKEEKAQLRKRLDINVKGMGSNKVYDKYRKKMYNEMVDVIVELKQKNQSRIYKHDIACPSLDRGCRESILPLRIFVRSYMTKSNNLVQSKYPEEKKHVNLDLAPPEQLK